ncbi:exopolyphosphatase [Robbsia andropogonis]|uniref:Exopolyphosphatase n=1 Tax=Robbsia andropogonis TaxID=28092 RepID=A0A0F5K288_9BURK|nr:exopolyphosphatase [Robbsia andropogonis]KKB64030.1 exopolyphosphatase [Robbsia andropogonis]MCP1119806.1 exopolyphosphatase [Robbsia andropogonis]MCP1128839.1 exopolyphosphatase [Robbsia andropogonis]
MADNPTLLAAVDMGSNSFRLIVGRVETTAAGSQIQQIDAMREPVRLGAGLTTDKILDEAAQRRGLEALERFGERLRGFPHKRVRAVATNTLRVAKNANEFIDRAHKALGFPIEVIAGREEARLIYAGAAHTVPPAPDKRLVVDIGGGSTEFIIGREFEPLLMESLYIGCVSHSRLYFADDVVTEAAMHQAILAARREIELIGHIYRDAGWEQSIGSSGTARALAELIEDNGFNDSGISHGITRNGLERLRRALVKAGSATNAKLIGLKPDRVPVLPGGLSIMIGVFEELGIDYADVTDGALRLGVLYDLMGRGAKQDVRAVTVESFMQRYAVDRRQAARIGALSTALLDQFFEDEVQASPKESKGKEAKARRQATADDRDNLAATVASGNGHGGNGNVDYGDSPREVGRTFLGWAASLHEIGLSIGHGGYHKHSAYIASNADMPGFSRTDQQRLATLLLGHIGKLGKFQASSDIDWDWLFCLRTAVLLSRRRTDDALPTLRARRTRQGYELALPREWVDAHPMTELNLAREAAEWTRVGRAFKIVYA